MSTANAVNEFTFGILGETFAFSQCYNQVTVTDAFGLLWDI